MKYLFFILLLIIIFIAGIYNKKLLAIINNYKDSPLQTIEANTPIIDIKSIKKLETIEITIKNKQFTVKGLRGNTNTGDTYDVFVTVNGKVIAGINLDKIQILRQDNEKKIITLSLPTSKILHVYPERTPTIELYKRHGIGNLFGQPSDLEKDKARNKAKNMLIRDARNADILNRATEQAKKYIEEYVISFGYRVKFVKK